MGYVPFVVVISGLVVMLFLLNYHTFKNYRAHLLDLISKIQEAKKQVRSDVDQLEFLSVPEMEGFCENMYGYLSGNLESQTLEQQMSQVNQAFEYMYSSSESKHIQEEILSSINQQVKQISIMHQDLKSTQYAYEKLLTEKPYSQMAKWMNFQPVPIPWEKQKAPMAA